MEIRDPDLKMFVEGLNTEFRALKEQFEEDNKVDLVNGKRETVKLKVAVSMIHDDVKKQGAKIDKIEEATEFLIDFNKIHKLFKKRKLYWLIILISSLFFSHNVWQPILLGLFGKL
ncbi:MAG: hypothetical protein ACERKJ_11630 [Candidatus Dadabacteria bacterium]